MSLIRQRLLTAQSRQKSYADVRRRPLEFEVGDHVFLKVMPKRGVVRFGKRGNLSLRFIGPFEILEREGTIAYRLALPPNMSGVYKVFHVSMLRRYTPDPADEYLKYSFYPYALVSFSSVFMLNKCPNALKVHTYDQVIHLVELYKIGGKNCYGSSRRGY